MLSSQMIYLWLMFEAFNFWNISYYYLLTVERMR